MQGQQRLETLRGHVENLEGVLEVFLIHVVSVTDGGKKARDHQVLVRHLAGHATAIRAARAVFDYATAFIGAEQATFPILDAAEVFVGQTVRKFKTFLDYSIPETGAFLPGPATPVVKLAADDRIQAIGAHLVSNGAENNLRLGDETLEMTRETARRIADEVVAPLSQDIHQGNLDVPEQIIRAMSEAGFFGMSVPEEFYGSGFGNVAMCLVTEELSRASLAAAGSLITRPEILTKALEAGGTKEQKRLWLPKIASGETLVAISVTEPDTGSDVSAVACRMEPVDGGYVINGSKAWCTFAGRANIIALLARTDPDSSKGYKGLSLAIVEKDSFPGEKFKMVQPGGGILEGEANATPGYRGMHSFTLAFENFFVPAENIVGGEDGLGKGFKLQMGGFEAGRLQTGARGTGVAQAAIEATLAYGCERKQFGQRICDFGDFQHKLGQMFVHTHAARQLTCAAAQAQDNKAPDKALLASMAKLFASQVAVSVSQTGQVLHGGAGYSEEMAICRYVLDALVLLLFEGTEPVLEQEVIGRGLIRGGTKA